ncbi:MAG: DUF4097 family beta strand repeat-containing protein [Erysipelotrichaceae bacterium]|nr:DUF4097 family beta strand repeat-containing protein [Erysipelotrichaceae bacterium]
MTKQEYFDELKRKLRDYPEEYAELKEAFEEHFAEGERNGQSEEEIVRELGPVDDMIESLGLPKHSSDIREDFKDLGNAFGSFLNGLGDTIEEGVRNLDLDTKVREFSERITEAAGSAVNEAVRPQNGSIGAPVSRIEVWGDSMDLRLSASQDDGVYYEYTPGLTVFVKGINELKIENDAGYVVFRENSPLGMGLIRSSSLLELKVPEGVTVEFHSKSGDLRAEDLALEQLAVKTLSGDHELTNIRCTSIRIDSVSGDLDMQKSTYKEFRAKTVSGDYELDACSGNVSIETVSGDIGIDSLQGDSIYLKTISGDTSVSCVCEQLKSSTTSGDQKIRFIDCGEEALISTQSGDVDIEVDLTDCRIDMKALSGDIRFPNAEEAVRYDDHHYQIGSGSSRISVSTSSGDIRIR